MIYVIAAMALGGLLLHGSYLFSWVARLVRLFMNAGDTLSPALPRAAVVLSVRGADPYLAHCLDGLLRQDYPNYEICVVIDSRQDAAWDVVQGACSTQRGVAARVQILQDPLKTCSLKMSALLQAIEGLDGSCEIVVLIDADVIPHASWLRELASPLLDDQIGAASGIRWFEPRSCEMGTLVRYLWNAAATAHMVALSIPWGGSLAIRLDVLRQSGLLERWALSLFEDVACYDALRQVGKKVQFVPAATMINHESITLKNCFHFIRRQMLDARLYHSRWPTVLTLGLTSTAALLAAGGALIAAFFSGDNLLAGGLIVGLGVYFVGLILLLLRIERLLTSRVRSVRGAALAEGSLESRPRTWGWRMLLALPLAQAVYVTALVSACWLRRVQWRGISYDFRGPHDVRLIEYRPATSTNQHKTASVS